MNFDAPTASANRTSSLMAKLVEGPCRPPRRSLSRSERVRLIFECVPGMFRGFAFGTGRMLRVQERQETWLTRTFLERVAWASARASKALRFRYPPSLLPEPKAASYALRIACSAFPAEPASPMISTDALGLRVRLTSA